MNPEKKLIACSILALTIGISSVIPLVFFMSATVKAETLDSSWFSIDMPYAYWIVTEGPLANPPVEFPWSSEMNATNSVTVKHTIFTNTTLIVDPKAEDVDGRVEYYQIDVKSDKQLIETIYWYVGTNANSSFRFDGLLDSIHFVREDWFDTDLFYKVSNKGYIRYNWTVGFSDLGGDRGSGTGSAIGTPETKYHGGGTVDTFSALREAETLTITIYRKGWTTFTGNSTIFTSANNEIVDQIQLDKYGDGFLYNDMIPEDELSTIDLWNPPRD
jgi:hypothetical protein